VVTAKLFRVVHDKGTSHLEKWRLDNGKTILELGFTTEKGVKGGMTATHHFKNDDTLHITIEGLSPKLFSYTIIRGNK